ncbi:MAG TPA: polysaccharide biosynthesis/export family protein [Polyangia bacterium]|nr:polysaccharide biosynthesis/export family protein [Polyangia bacterium]
MLALAASTAVACATTATNYDYASEPDPRKYEFVLGPSDVLHVVVWKSIDLSVDATVRPDGTITLPLIGDLRAAGRTASELRAEIVQRLSTYVKEAQPVTVAVAAVNSYRFTVSGSVEHGGAFSPNHYVTFAEAIALAGGPNRYGSPDDAVILRTGKDGRQKRIPIDYSAILNGTRPDMNLIILPGDIVYIP